MNSDGKPDSVRLTKMNRRVLIRRGLIAALILICMASAYSFFLVFRFHEDIATLQKSNAKILINYRNDLGLDVLGTYGESPPHPFIPGPLLRYHRSIALIELYHQPNSKPEEIDELFHLLPHFPKLKYLYLVGFSINQENALNISRLKNLEMLVLTKCQIEKSCLVPLIDTNSLTYIDLSDSEFQETELGTLKLRAVRESLTDLKLSNCVVTDRTAEYLSHCRKLEHLELDGTQITDRGLKILARLPQLRVLVLDHTNVTDAGVAYLSSTPNLIELSLSNTEVSDESLETLKRDIPALRVSDD